MIIRRGNMFDTELEAIGHGVNCAGVMGAGVAKKIRELYPHNYENYRAACQRKQLKPGGVHVNREYDTYIVNMASQNMPGADASYPWLFESALNGANGAVKRGLDSIAIPMIGCGIGGLEWFKAAAVLEAVEAIVENDFEWEVWMQ